MNQRTESLYTKTKKAAGVYKQPTSELRARLDEVEQLEEGKVWNVCGSGIYPIGCPYCQRNACWDDTVPQR